MSDDIPGTPRFTRGERIADNMVRIGLNGIWIQEVAGIELRDLKAIRGRIALEIDEAFRQGEIAAGKPKPQTYGERIAEQRVKISDVSGDILLIDPAGTPQTAVRSQGLRSNKDTLQFVRKMMAIILDEAYQAGRESARNYDDCPTE